MQLGEGDLMVEEDGVSRFGLHRRHVIRYGERVSDKAIEELENQVKIEVHPPAPPRTMGATESAGCAIEIIAVVRYVEEGLGLHHLRIYWREKSEIASSQNSLLMTTEVKYGA